MFHSGTKRISADRFPRCSNVPVWKHLIERTFTTDERVSLITDLFSDRGEIEALKNLSGGDAQLFVDVIDEVPSHSRAGMTGPLTCAQTLIRCWMAWYHGSGGSVWPYYAGYAATTL